VQRARMIAGLRELADTLEQFPGLPVPFVYASLYLDAGQARAARRGVHGWVKRNSAGSAYVSYEKAFGPVELSISVSKSGTCERVQVDTRHVEAVPRMMSRSISGYASRAARMRRERPGAAGAGRAGGGGGGRDGGAVPLRAQGPDHAGAAAVHALRPGGRAMIAILPWTGVLAGDLALYDGGLVQVEDIQVRPADELHPEFLVACISGTELDSGRSVHFDPPAASLTAVQRIGGAA
jgi:hypothetical protein